jgi:hypothetical protein
MPYDLLEMIPQIANKPGFQMVVRVVFRRRPFLVAMCSGLLLSQGCAMLQRSSDTSAPTETTVQPAPAKPETAKPPIEKTPPAQAKRGKLRGTGRNTKENGRPVERFLIKGCLRPRIEPCPSAAK